MEILDPDKRIRVKMTPHYAEVSRCALRRPEQRWPPGWHRVAIIPLDIDGFMPILESAIKTARLRNKAEDAFAGDFDMASDSRAQAIKDLLSKGQPDDEGMG